MSSLVWSREKPTKPGNYWFMKLGGPLEAILVPVPEIFEYLSDEDTEGVYAGPVYDIYPQSTTEPRGIRGLGE